METNRILKATKELTILASPIALGQISHMLIGVGDVFIAARHGTVTVAAIGIANSIGHLVFLIGLGLLLGISPTLARKRGQSEQIKDYFYTCIVYALLIGVVFSSLTMLTTYIVPLLGFEKHLVPIINDYLFLVSFSYIGAYIFNAVKEYLQASERVIIPNTISLIAVPLNVVLNYLFVFGVGFIPECGARGLAYATIITRTLMGISVFIYALKFDKVTFSIVRNYAKHVFKFSIPISMSIFIEVLAFSVVMILIGRIGSIYAAVHSIALTLCSTTFMIPLSVSSAVSVKISYFNARHKKERVLDFIKASLFISMSFMAVAGIFMYSLPKTILSFFTPDPNIIYIGVPIIFVCALFQILDGAQVTLSGILRGLGITKPTFFIVATGYWIVGIPFGYYLGTYKGMNVLGFWVGIAVALSLIALMLFVYLGRKLNNLTFDSPKLESNKNP
jgi:multidrug resistance protein, MATE family